MTSNADEHARIAQIQAVIFDLDGTVYLGDTLLPGARELISGLRRDGKAVRFVSNNPTRDPGQYIQKLDRLGIEADVGEVMTSGVAMAKWLATHEPGKTVYPLGEEPLVQQLTAYGVPLSDDPGQVDIVVASYDRAFTYEKLQTAFDALWFHKQARLFATNLDPYCPLAGGRGEPDAGAIVAAIEACTGVTCAHVAGKPEPAVLAMATDGLDVEPERCLVVGDRLHTDMQLAHNTGAQGALILTGDSTCDDVAALPAGGRPHYVLENLDALRTLMADAHVLT